MILYILLTVVYIIPSVVHAQQPLASYIDPFIGTSNDHGQTDPSANVPFGMIKPGPDTKPGGQSGYNFLADAISGFSQTRVSGVGCTGAGGNLRLLPFIDTTGGIEKIDKSTEVAQAGYYSVKLMNGIKAEITASRTSAIYHFTYPAAKKAGLSLDLTSALATFKEENHEFVGNNTIQGWVQATNTCDMGMYTFYYHIEINKDEVEVTEDNGRVCWNFPSGKNETVMVKIGLSTVSQQHAKENKAIEIGGKTFAQVREAATESWEQALRAIRVETTDGELKKSFYTRMYHACQTPFNITDCDAQYRGSDGRVYYTAGNYYHGWSIWDTFRTKEPLMSLIYPDKYRDMMFSLAKLYRQGKADWATDTEPFPTVRTEHSIILLLDALRKGLISKETIELVFDRILAEAENIPFNSPDKMLERCYDLWAISQIARELNLPVVAQKFLNQSGEYRPVWNDKFKLMGPSADIMHGDGLYEGTLWQYRWFVPHDLDWLINAIGSKEKTIAELDYFFQNHLFNIGNQPDIHVPYLYYNLGQPWKAQKLVRDILLEPTVNCYGTHDKWKKPYVGKVFKTTPDGYLKEMDDDAGTMSSWFILSSIGLYPVCSGTPYYWISSPVFDSVTIQLNTGKTFRMIAVKESGEDTYIQSASLNGKMIENSWISYEEIMAGGELIIQLGAHPNKEWGAEVRLNQ
ncbi:glycoside hydrolase family 92 protein [Bacteroides sp. 51]|nr:glycoside hydrolase family 92 protein [Bacteroides sp. 51]